MRARPWSSGRGPRHTCQGQVRGVIMWPRWLPPALLSHTCCRLLLWTFNRSMICHLQSAQDHGEDPPLSSSSQSRCGLPDFGPKCYNSPWVQSPVHRAIGHYLGFLHRQDWPLNTHIWLMAKCIVRCFPCRWRGWNLISGASWCRGTALKATRTKTADRGDKFPLEHLEHCWNFPAKVHRQIWMQGLYSAALPWSTLVSSNVTITKARRM